MTVIVEHVEPGSKAGQAGVRGGDRLFSYAGKPLTSPAMLLALEDNTFGPESVTLCGAREEQAQEWALPPGESGAEVRPELPETVLAEYERGRAAFRAKDYTGAVRVWGDIAPQVPREADRAWLYQRAGEAAERVFDWNAGYTFYSEACQWLQADADSAAHAMLWITLGRCCQKRSDYNEAQAWFEQARQVNEAASRAPVGRTELQ